MNRTLFIIIVLLFIVFPACKKTKWYTTEQKNAFKTLDGNYHSYVGNEKISGLMSFMAHYAMPLAVKEGKKISYYLHGECLFWDYNYSIPDVGYIQCYYSLSDNADVLFLYYNGGENDKKLLREYNLYIESKNVFSLVNNGKTLRFEKLK